MDYNAVILTAMNYAATHSGQWLGILGIAFAIAAIRSIRKL